MRRLPCGQSAQTDNNIQAELQNAIEEISRMYRYSVKNGVVDLEGTVKNFATKEDDR